MGLAYLQLADKTKARMAFEQAAASNADPKSRNKPPITTPYAFTRPPIPLSANR